MNILVIGNGFDLALGLPTKYTNFLDFVKEFYNFYFETLESRSEENNNYFLSEFKNRFAVFAKVTDHPEFDIICDDLYCCVNKNKWIDYFQYRYKKNLISGEKWIDLERETKGVVEILQDDAFWVIPGADVHSRFDKYDDSSINNYGSRSFLEIFNNARKDVYNFCRHIFYVVLFLYMREDYG